MNIAFVLLTYGPDEPAGFERSIAALTHGLAGLGHPAHVIAGGPATGRDGPEIVRLATLRLPRPATEDQLLAAINDRPDMADEVRDLLRDLGSDLVCWVDTSWGLGFLAPNPGIPAVLMVRVLRTDDLIHQALAHRPQRVLTNSCFLMEQAQAAGFDVTDWRAVPNALLIPGQPPGVITRERLRQSGPIRVVVRAEPHKGITELLQACPRNLDRKLEIVLASAAFEYWAGMQDQVIANCLRLAEACPQVRILPTLAWREVQPFLAGAAATIIASTSPETFCLTALEALSVATPVCSFDLGHVPALVATAGVTVPLEIGAAGLWEAVRTLLADPAAYHQASARGPQRAAGHSPQAAASAFIAAVDFGRPAS